MVTQNTPKNIFRLTFSERINNRKGFSMIELVIVLSIIGILASIAIPGFLKWVPNFRLKGDARDLYSNVQKAKLEAVKRNVCTGVVFTTVAFPATGGGYTIFIDNGAGGGTACNGTQDGTEEVILTNGVGSDVSLISASNIGGPSAICFNSNSLICGSQMGNITLQNNQSRWYRLTVSASGGLRLEMSGDNATWIN